MLHFDMNRKRISAFWYYMLYKAQKKQSVGHLRLLNVWAKMLHAYIDSCCEVKQTRVPVILHPLQQTNYPSSSIVLASKGSSHG